MSRENPKPLVCRNGHQQQNTNANFCIYCGTSLAPIEQAPKLVKYERTELGPMNRDVSHVEYKQPIANLPAQQYFPTPTNQPCVICSGGGRTLDKSRKVCPECKWLRPLVDGYGIDPAAFQWAEDGKAMAVLRSLSPLKMAAEMVSKTVGRRWIETTFNGVLLGDDQLPHVYFQAVRAAQILGMSYMPDIYISGDLMWDCRTYGTDSDSFVIMGSTLAMNFKDKELLFLFAREMGHCRSGHALWKTVIKFLVGDRSGQRGLMRDGLFAEMGKFLSPSALIEGTIEIPLMAWARQAEITADRAGMLAVGDEHIVRKVLLTWSLRSALLFQQINLDMWLKQQSAENDDMTKFSEMITSSTPYITRRLKLIEEFSKSEHFKRWRSILEDYRIISPQPKTSVEQNVNEKEAEKNVFRIKCSNCKTPMKIPSSVLNGKNRAAIRCPNAKCRKVTYLSKQVPDNPESREIPNSLQTEVERSINYD